MKSFRAFLKENQRKHNYHLKIASRVDPEILEKIEQYLDKYELLDITPIEVYEVATFYSQFYLDPVGKYVFEVCQTGPCAICGGEDIIAYLEEKLQIKVGETTPDRLFSLKAVECLGACGSAPVMQVNTEFYEFLDLKKIDEIIEKLRAESDKKKPEELTWKERLS
jgi:NADH-quinone oxidoreductase subunit E